MLVTGGIVSRLTSPGVGGRWARVGLVLGTSAPIEAGQRPLLRVRLSAMLRDTRTIPLRAFPVLGGGTDAPSPRKENGCHAEVRTDPGRAIRRCRTCCLEGTTQSA